MRYIRKQADPSAALGTALSLLYFHMAGRDW